jgi:hypothetical protein
MKNIFIFFVFNLIMIKKSDLKIEEESLKKKKTMKIEGIFENKDKIYQTKI